MPEGLDASVAAGNANTKHVDEMDKGSCYEDGSCDDGNYVGASHTISRLWIFDS